MTDPYVPAALMEPQSVQVSVTLPRETWMLVSDSMDWDLPPLTASTELERYVRVRSERLFVARRAIDRACRDKDGNR